MLFVLKQELDFSLMIKAVSYTHLDVYKRQALDCVIRARMETALKRGGVE